MAVTGEQTLLRVDAVDHGYRGRPVLRGCSLDLRPGVTALVGRNGAGKTTLIRLLATAEAPQHGRICVGGTSLWDSGAALRRYRGTLGWVPQKVTVGRGVSVAGYLRHIAWLRGLDRPQARAEQERVAALLDLDGEMNRAMRRLSGGTFQRVVLAGALLGRPRVLLLDEPTVGLDPAQRAAYLALVRDCGQGATVLLSTHLLEDVVQCADRVLLLTDGRIGLDEEATQLRGCDGRLHAEDLARVLFT